MNREQLGFDEKLFRASWRVRRRSKWHTMCLVLAVVFAMGCHEQVLAPPTTSVRLSSETVTGAAAQALGADGLFVLREPEDSPVPILSNSEAVRRAELWAKRFGPLQRGRYERGVGTVIDFDQLRACSRQYFAESAFEPPPTATPNYVKNFVGPRWLVSLCTAFGTPQVSLALAAYATDVKIADEQFVFPAWSGNEFFSVPRGPMSPLEPEAAASFLARATGARVSSVPQLVLGYATIPQLARWRIVLERSVTVTSSARGASLSTSEFYVGRDGSTENILLSVANPLSSRVEVRPYLEIDSVSQARTTKQLVLQVRPGLSIGLELVTVDNNPR